MSEVPPTFHRIPTDLPRRHHGQRRQRPREGTRRRSRPDRAPVRQGLDHAPGRGGAHAHRGDPHGIDRPRHRPGHRRPAPWPHRGDLRPGVLGQDHAGPARHRQCPGRWRPRGLHRCRARSRPRLRVQAGHRPRQPLRLTARHGRAGAGDLRHACPLRCHRPRGHRLRCRPGAPRRDRGRDGRLACRPAGPPDEPGPAQDGRCAQQHQHDLHLHQPAAREDRRHVRLAGDHHGWQGAEVLRVGATGRAPYRDPQGRHRGSRQPHPRQGRQEQGRAAVQAGRVRHPVRRGHLT